MNMGYFIIFLASIHFTGEAPTCDWLCQMSLQYTKTSMYPSFKRLQ